MKSLLISIIFVSLSSARVFAGAGVFPQGSSIKMIKDSLKFKTGRTIESNDVDPQAVATPADSGSVLINNNGVYIKTDNGSTTNWTKLQTELPLNYTQDRTAIVRDNLLDCPNFNACAPEGVITNGAGIDLSGTTTRAVEVPAFNGSKLNLTQSAAGTLDYTYTKTASFDGKQMVTYCEIKTANTGVTFNSIVDGVIQDTLSVSSTDTWKYYKLPFVGGATSQGFKIDHVTATEIPNIDIANCFIGKDANQIREISGASFVGKLDLSNNCIYNRTGLGYDYLLDSDSTCSATSIEGSVSLPVFTNRAGVKILNPRTDGYYNVSYNGLFYKASAANNCQFTWSKTNSLSDNGEAYVGVSSANGSNSSLSASFRFENGESEIYVIGESSNAATTCSMYGTSGNSGAITVHFFPDDTSTIVTQDTELTAKTANSFSVKVKSDFTVEDDDFDIINGNCVASDTNKDRVCTFNTGIFTNTPHCYPNLERGATVAGVSFNIHTVSSTGFTARAINQSSNAALNDMIVTCTKTGNDLNKSQTIVGKFENINSDDLCQLYVGGSDGSAISANTEDIGFTTTNKDNCSNWSNDGNSGTNLNDRYTFDKNGRYQLDISLYSTSGVGTWNIQIYKNGSVFGNLAFCESSQICSGSRAIDVVAGDYISIRSSDAFTPINSVSSYYFQVTQSADYEAIVKNLSNQKTKCQTKFLTANVTTSGVVSDLGFSDLDTSKYYSLTMNTSLVYSVSNYCILGYADGVKDVLRVMNREADAGSDRTVDTGTNPFFKPSTSTVTATFQEGATCVLEGNSSYNETWATLCELPGTYVETTEF